MLKSDMFCRPACVLIANRLLLSLFFVASLFFIAFSLPSSVLAALSACSVTVDPPSADISTTANFSVQLTNEDYSGARMVWMKIVRPSADYTIISGSPNGIPTDMSDSYFSTWGFDAGGGSAFGQDITASVNNVAFTGFWAVLASDDAGGANPTTCTGTLDARIFDPVNSVPPVISDLTISDLTATSVKLSWTTDKAATSVVDYGTTSDYGSTKNDATMVTSHVVTIDSLTANSTYHYRITSVDSHNNTIQTADNTLTSALYSAPVTTTTVTSVVVVTQTSSSTPKIIPDTTPPSLYIATDFSKPFKEAPKISGRASDNKQVSKIEYSLDNGRNWQPVDNASYGKATVQFDFTPVSLDDDNYKVKVRARDNSGNTGVSKVYTMVIDRLPPEIGESFFSLGPQPLLPDKDGIILGLEGLDQKVTLSSVGGPITVDILSNSQVFSLVKNIDNGLWGGFLSFEKAGVFPLEVNSLDGAGNTAKRTLNSLIILPRGQVLYNGKAVKDALVTVYYFDSLTKRFVLWDGAAYGQKNPQKTDKDGKYALFMPPGKYYLEVKAPTFRILKTNIFTVDKSIPVNNKFVLEKQKGISIGSFTIPFFDFRETQAEVIINYPGVFGNLKQKQNLIGKELPDVDLKDLQDTVSTVAFRGKPTFVTILSSWNPFSSNQLSILNNAQTPGMSFVTIFPQETSSRISIYKKRGGYGLSMLADPDGQLVKPLNIQSLPLHILLNRKGVIEKVATGVLTDEEISRLVQ